MATYADNIRTPPRTLTEVEQQRLLKVTGEHKAGFRDHVLFSLALGTGLRDHELLALDVGDVFGGGAIGGIKGPWSSFGGLGKVGVFVIVFEFSDSRLGRGSGWVGLRPGFTPELGSRGASSSSSTHHKAEQNHRGRAKSFTSRSPSTSGNPPNRVSSMISSPQSSHRARRPYSVKRW